jgi:hypothetical protein
MTTLTDRYVWAVLRSVPQRQRAELEPEVRALVADAVEARGGGAPTEAAERAALIELGDPDSLAARYTDATRFLIGPRLYPEWERLLLLLLPIVVPISGIAVGAVGWVSGKPVGEAIVSGLGVAFTVAVQLTFWFTLVFAIAERTGSAVVPATGRPWTPDLLPDVPAPDRMSLGEAVASIAFGLGVLVALVWVQLWSPIVIDGTAYPLFDPATWAWWVWYVLALTIAEIVFATALYLRGRWTYGSATVNAILALAFAIPVLWFVQGGALLNPALVDVIDAQAGGDWLTVTMSIIALVVILVSAIDAVDGFRKAWRTSRQRSGAVQAPG